MQFESQARLLVQPGLISLWDRRTIWELPSRTWGWARHASSSLPRLPRTPCFLAWPNFAHPHRYPEWEVQRVANAASSSVAGFD